MTKTFYLRYPCWFHVADPSQRPITKISLHAMLSWWPFCIVFCRVWTFLLSQQDRHCGNYSWLACSHVEPAIHNCCVDDLNTLKKILLYRRMFGANVRQCGQIQSTGGKRQRREEKKREDQRRERVRRKKMQVQEKVEKLRITVNFPGFLGPEGRKVGSLKRRVRSQKNCRPLWREAHVEVKKAQNTSVPEPFWKLTCRKSPLWRQANLEVEVEMLKKCTVQCEAHFEAKHAK